MNPLPADQLTPMHLKARAYYWENAERIKARAKKHRLDNLERYRARDRIRNRKWYHRSKPLWYDILVSARARSKRLGIAFDLTKEWAKATYTGKCVLSGLPFIRHIGRGAGLFSPSLDRIDPNGGYTQNNCRFILSSINSFKGAGTDEEMFLIVARLAEAAKARQS